MAWFLNHYSCERCHGGWSDDWSCMCDDDCPHCGARHMSPYDSEDLTYIIVPDGNAFVVFQSSADAEYSPDYRELARAETRADAKTLLANLAP